MTAVARSRGLLRPEAAEYVSDRYFPCSKRTLAKLACIGGGPKFRKAGKTVIYDPPDLDEYAASKMTPHVRSTSELRPSRKEARAAV